MHFSIPFFGAAAAASTAVINYASVQPSPHPEPVTVAEKVAIKFKPHIHFNAFSCVSFPAVNEAGEISSGLSGGGSSTACDRPRSGTQIYGRAESYEDKFAIMYDWYFPNGFWGKIPSRRHDWASAIVWIDDPALEKPSILGLSISTFDDDYDEMAPLPMEEVRIMHDTSVCLTHTNSVFGDPYLALSTSTGYTQDLIMWEQLPDAAQKALNEADFGSAAVPISDKYFKEKLEVAWPF